MREALQQLQELPAEVLHEKCSKVHSRNALSEWQLAACLLACERTQLFRQHGCSNVVQYAVRFLQMDAQKASQLLQTATFLEHLSDLSEAFRTGQLGWGKVRELKQVMTPETEPEWLAFALTHSVEELRHAVAMNPKEDKLRAQAATLASPVVDLFSESPQDIPSTPSEPVARETESESSYKGATVLPGAAAPTVRPVGKAEVPKPPTGGLPLPPAAPQLVRVTLVFTPEEYVAFQEAEKHVRKLLPKKRARREAVVAEMARRSLGAAPARTRARHTVIVHVNADTEEAWFETERGTLPVAAEELAEALTSGTITYANRTPNVPQNRTETETFSRGKRKRTPIPVAILRQLYARAGGCCEAPGCSNRTHLQAHHKKAWSRGGSHELECLELLCSACHGQTHEEDFRDDPEWSQARARKQGTRRRRPAAAGG